MFNSSGLVSQKAKSLTAMGGLFLPHAALGANSTAQQALDALNHIKQYITGGPDQQIFVRPCPEFPTHGNKVAGYQSVPVTRKGAMRTVAEILYTFRSQQVPADLILMPFIKADYSAVASPGRYIVWGQGHDGITAGHGQSIVLPVQPEEDYSWLTPSNVPLDQAEIEYVASTNKIFGVQVRKAPAHLSIASQPIGSFAGFLPTETMQIEHLFVVHSLDDLEELEVLKSAPAGTLVIQPAGSMMSHAAAHCRGAGLGFAVAEPELFQEGDHLSQVAQGWLMVGLHDTVPVYNPMDYWDEFVKGFDHIFTDAKQGIELGTFFHQFSTAPLTHSKVCAYLAGAFVKSLLVLGVSACLGETRYYKHITSQPERQKVALALSTIGIGGAASRTDVYNRFLHSELKVADIRGLAEFARRVHGHKQWTPGVGYGGIKWAICAQGVLNVLKAIDNQDMTEVIETVNTLEHAVHNGGKLFNKFSGVPDALDRSTTPFWIKPGLNQGNLPVVIAAFTALAGPVTPKNPRCWEKLIEFVEKFESPAWLITPSYAEVQAAVQEAAELQAKMKATHDANKLEQQLHANEPSGYLW